MRSFLSAALCVLLVLCSGLAQAAPITYQFSGTIDKMLDQARFGDKIKVGDSYVATFIFDSAAPNLDHSNLYGGLYVPLSSAFKVGQVTFTGLSQSTGQHGDGYYPQTLTVEARGGPSFMSLRAECSSSPDAGALTLDGAFIDWIDTAISSTSLPLPSTAPGLSAFQQTYLMASDPATKSEEFWGTITSLQITPEPGALVLLLLASVSTCLRRRM